MHSFTFALPNILITENSSQANSQISNVDDTHNKTVHSADDKHLVDTNQHKLKVESVIRYGEPARYGVIKWIGNLPGQVETFAGVEMVRLLICLCNNALYFIHYCNIKIKHCLSICPSFCILVVWYGAQ